MAAKQPAVLGRAAQRSKRHSRGVGLIDALVSVLMLSLSALAAMGASALATRYSADRQHQTTASLLAQDLAERMRAHQGRAADDATAASAFMAGSYDLTVPWGEQQVAVDGAASCMGASDACSPLDMARADLAHWRQRLQASLPQGAAWVRREPGSGMADIWVVWAGPSFGADGAHASNCPSGLQLPDSGGMAGADDSLSSPFRCWHLRVLP